MELLLERLYSLACMGVNYAYTFLLVDRVHDLICVGLTIWLIVYITRTVATAVSYESIFRDMRDKANIGCHGPLLPREAKEVENKFYEMLEKERRDKK